MIRPALALLLLLAPPAHAQERDAKADARTIARCLEAEGRDGAAACIGRIGAECRDVPGGDTTAGIALCNVAETAAWDRLLNETYRKLVAAAKAGGYETSLRAAQRAWVAFRDADCAFAYAMWGAGSMRQIAGSACQMERTATRAIELRAFLDEN
jgi:uncharacterized protein YecT (DUF1311 family)